MQLVQSFILLFLLALTIQLLFKGMSIAIDSLRRYWERLKQWWQPTSPQELQRLQMERIAKENEWRRTQTRIRSLHTAFRQLSRSYDFRRAMAIASRCKALPALLREKFFVQYRPALVRHFATCVRRGVSSESLVKQLRELVKLLAVDALEADYIANTALANQRKLLRWLELSLLQMERSPDFQRALCMAQQCETLPAAVRQRLFVKYRSAMVRHYVRCLQRRSSQTRLQEQLVRLVIALATASFEAEYIQRQALQRMPVRQAPKSPTYDQQLARLRQNRDHRIAAIRARVDDEELREQLIEEIDTELREQMLQLNRADQNRPNNSGGP